MNYSSTLPGTTTSKILSLIVLAMLTIQPVHATEVSWTNTFVFAGSGGITDPLVQVGFNPQPEPPAAGLLSFNDPPVTGFPPDPVITHSGSFNATPFRVIFGITNGVFLNISATAFSASPVGNSFMFDVMNDFGGVVFQVEFEMTTSSGGLPIGWASFNPQPEPPAIGAEAALFGADFTFDSFSDVSLAIRIRDAAGTPIALARVSEPTTFALLVLVLAGICTSRRKTSA